MADIHDVAVIGVGCTKFGENFDWGVDDMLSMAVTEAVGDAGIDPEQIEAGWIGIQYPFTGMSGATLSDSTRLYDIPITHVENYCASGLDAFRNACIAVAAEMYDIVIACGVEKITDQGGRGLPGVGGTHPVMMTGLTAPSAFGLAFERHSHAFGTTREHLAHVAVKNHYNGAANPKAHFRREVTLEQVMKAPPIAGPMGLLDCCPISDGSAAAIITRKDIAKKYRDDYVTVKGVALAAYTTLMMYDKNFDYLAWRPTVKAAEQAYKMAGITNPVKEIDFAEVHDCFTITEILNVEDLGFCKKGEGGPATAEGRFNIDGETPVNPSGGLKCFGHPIGATGIRMIYEVTKQLQGRADGRQVENPKVGLAHNLGGMGGVMCGIAILTNEN